MTFISEKNVTKVVTIAKTNGHFQQCNLVKCIAYKNMQLYCILVLYYHITPFHVPLLS